MSFIEIDDKYYVLATSSFTDDRTIVLKQGDSFGIFDRYGDIHQVEQGAQGLYHQGTRFISRMEFSFEGKCPSARALLWL